MYKLVVFTSHPIQYQAPFFKALASESGFDPLIVFSDKKMIGGGYFDKDFNREIAWDVPLLDGYKSVFLNNVLEINSLLKKEKPNALIVYGWNSLYSWVSFFSALWNKIPFFIYGENTLDQEILKKRFFQFIRHKFLQTLFKVSSGCLFIGEGNRRFYEHFGVRPEKLFFVPYAVDNGRFFLSKKERKTQRENLRKVLKIKKEAIVILFVGKLIDKKRPFDLLRAYEKLIFTIRNQEKLSVYLLFVGDGVLRKDLEDYAEEKGLADVIFLGFKNQVELPRYYAVSDIFVLPSGIGETWGLVVNEAMCLGLPIVVSDIVGCGTDLVREGENGYIFRLGDVDALSERLKKIISDRPFLKSFGEKSLEIIQDFNFKKDIEGITKALESIK